MKKEKTDFVEIINIRINTNTDIVGPARDITQRFSSELVDKILLESPSVVTFAVDAKGKGLAYLAESCSIRTFGKVMKEMLELLFYSWMDKKDMKTLVKKDMAESKCQKCVWASTMKCMVCLNYDLFKPYPKNQIEEKNEESQKKITEKKDR